MAGTSFVEEMEERFADYLASDDEQVVMAAQAFVYGCAQYNMTTGARNFLNKNKNPSAKELGEYFARHCPGGLASGDDGADLLE